MSWLTRGWSRRRPAVLAVALCHDWSDDSSLAVVAGLRGSTAYPLASQDDVIDARPH